MRSTALDIFNLNYFFLCYYQFGSPCEQLNEQNSDN